MTIRNYLFSTKDLKRAGEIRDKYNWEHDYPHVDLWRKSDALLKWTSVLERFMELYPDNGVTVVDLGCARGSVPHVISGMGNIVTGVDSTKIDARLDHACVGSKVTMVDSNVWDWFPDVEDESIDVFTDLCSITHFCGRSGICPDGKSVLNNVFRECYRCLKPGGHFIMSSDCMVDSDEGEYQDPQVIIERAAEEGLKFVGEWYDTEDRLYTVPGFAHLNVCCLTFVK